MDTVIPGLFATAAQPLSFAPSIGVRSFLLEREEGNLLIYSSNTIEQEGDFVREKGGIWRQYMNHGHEADAADAACRWVASTFGAPLHAHVNEREEISRVCDVNGVFSERHMLADDFEVIPIPGHTSGATAFLWDTGEHRVLFTGDSVKLEGDEWVAVLLDSSARENYLRSLELIQGLDFDVIAPWATAMEGSYFALTNTSDTERRIGRIIERMNSA